MDFLEKQTKTPPLATNLKVLCVYCAHVAINVLKRRKYEPNYTKCDCKNEKINKYQL